jgi:hypothetical protein
VRVSKNASRMTRKAQASETMSSVRATEHLRSPAGARDLLAAVERKRDGARGGCASALTKR